jgi:hypothetical protein
MPATVQLVTFRLAGISTADYEAHCAHVAPAFAGLPGLQSKVWLADPAANVFGGLYAWRDRAAMDAYVDGDLFAALQANPGLEDVRTRAFGVLEEPGRVTAGRA